jgi:hypothetical protein
MTQFHSALRVARCYFDVTSAEEGEYPFAVRARAALALFAPLATAALFIRQVLGPAAQTLAPGNSGLTRSNNTRPGAGFTPCEGGPGPWLDCPATAGQSARWVASETGWLTARVVAAAAIAAWQIYEARELLQVEWLATPPYGVLAHCYHCRYF